MKRNVKILCILAVILGLAGYSFGIPMHPGDNVQDKPDLSNISEMTIEEKYNIQERGPNDLDLELTREVEEALEQAVEGYNRQYKDQGIRFKTEYYITEYFSSNIRGLEQTKQYIKDIVIATGVNSVSTGTHKDHPSIKLLAMSFFSSDGMIHTFIFNIDSNTGNLIVTHHVISGKKVDQRSS